MATILLVMDDLVLLEATSLALEVFGHHTVINALGASAGALQAKRGSQFDLVIMGCSNGEMLEQQIVHRQPRPHIISCSSQNGNDLHRFAVTCIKPPTNAYDLLEPVQKILTGPESSSKK